MAAADAEQKMKEEEKVGEEARRGAEEAEARRVREEALPTPQTLNLTP